MGVRAGKAISRIPVREVVELLESQYGRAPMANRFDPMEELVSCILSQHTSDANSFPTFDRLRERYPDWQMAVDEGSEKVADVIRAAGLANQKSKSIVRCLVEIHRRTGGYSLDLLGTMPMLEARDWLTSLPGVGPKTASIVLCFSFGMAAIPVDTHVFRVSWRLGLIPEDMNEAKAHDALLAVVPGDLAFRFHMAFVQHGRMVCKAPLPRCDVCNIRDYCRWYKKGGPEKRRQELRKSALGRATKPAVGTR